MSRSALSLSSGIIMTCASFCAHAWPATSIEGGGGGGLATWAMLAPGKPTVSATEVMVQEYRHRTLAIAGSINDRIELSYARLTFDSGDIGLGNVNMDVFGAKLKLLDMSRSFATLSVGAQLKNNHDLPGSTMDALGIRDHSGTDAYIAATKVFPINGSNVLLDATVRLTKANQIGYFGFGSATNGNYEPHFEGSALVFLTDNLILGAEYRDKPNNIAGVKEDAWWNVFMGYSFSAHFSVVGAYANLGDIAAELTPHGANQTGPYLQGQFNF